MQYRAHNIVVASEEAAKGIIAQLKKGAKFDDLAKAQSTDPGAKTNGGDLGWFSPEKMVQAFSAAVWR